MSLVKRHLENLTYTIMHECAIEDTDDTFSQVFSWVMEQKYADMTEDELIKLYKKENTV